MGVSRVHRFVPLCCRALRSVGLVPTILLYWSLRFWLLFAVEQWQGGSSSKSSPSWPGVLKVFTRCFLRQLKSKWEVRCQRKVGSVRNSLVWVCWRKGETENVWFQQAQLSKCWTWRNVIKVENRILSTQFDALIFHCWRRLVCGQGVSLESGAGGTCVANTDGFLLPLDKISVV